MLRSPCTLRYSDIVRSKSLFTVTDIILQITLCQENIVEKCRQAKIILTPDAWVGPLELPGLKIVQEVGYDRIFKFNDAAFIYIGKSKFLYNPVLADLILEYICFYIELGFHYFTIFQVIGHSLQPVEFFFIFPIG